MKNRLEEFSKRSSLNDIKFPKKSREQVNQRITKIKRKNIFSSWNRKILSAATLLLLLAFPAYITYDAFKVEAPGQQGSTLESNQNPNAQAVTPDKPPVTKLENQYKSVLIQPISDQRNVLKFDTKQQLIKAFTEVMSHDLAAENADAFYRENSEGLFLESRGGPITLNAAPDYNLAKIKDREYKVTQEKSGEYTGNARLSITYIYHDGKWIIQDRNLKPLND